MGFRFRRSVKLLPGVRLNLGLNGLSLSAGPRGASVNLGARGLYGNLGVPGTGLSYRRRLDRGAVAAASFQAAAATPGATVEDSAVRMQLTLGLDPQGRLTIRDSNGNMLDPSLERRLRREHEPRLRAWLEDQEREIDGGFDRLTRVAGTAFAALPALQTLVVSGYSQRRDPATAQLRDDYLLSAQITRVAWQAIDFAALDQLDVVAAFERFEYVRDMSATGVFAPIEPLAQLPRGAGDGPPGAPPQG